MPPSFCVTIAPLKKTDCEETIRSAIKFSSVLPPPGYSIENSKEPIEIAHLSSVLGWSDPRGLFGYSETSEYKDLYIYFDYGDKTSNVNELATNAFKMYGLVGAMVSGKPTWGKIHGSVVILRMQPDLSFSPDAVYNSEFTLEEIYKTLVFFRDAEVSAHKIAVKRDGARFMKSRFNQAPPGTFPSAYMGPGGIRTATQMKNDTDECAKCGKKQSLVGRLKKCTVCQKTYYCSSSRACQKDDWKKLKKVCRTL
mmetsp:Transcript_3542/g.7824  ORF Transcript_3542/g.7824 Transcript_3542/m.7824 type:complete len:253 (+) Transcript_3542:166-924(+)